jgi:hypothetical protein
VDPHRRTRVLVAHHLLPCMHALSDIHQSIITCMVCTTIILLSASIVYTLLITMCGFIYF